MESGSLSAGDIMALTRDRDDGFGFGGVGRLHTSFYLFINTKW